MFYIPAVVVLVLVALLYPLVAPKYDSHWETVWVIFVLLIFAIYAMGSWKYGEVELVGEKTESKDTPPA